MKPKYRKRIDAWVERHLGDLAPDVLSEEVKWKILFKIERKKRRKERKKRLELQEELLREQNKRIYGKPWPVQPFNSADCERCRNSYLKKDPDLDRAEVACCIGHPTFVGPAFCGDFKERGEEKPSLCSTCKLFNECYDRHKGSQDKVFCPFYLINAEKKEEPRFCYECMHAVEDTSQTGKKKLLCKKWCYPRDPGFCGNFEERR